MVRTCSSPLFTELYYGSIATLSSFTGGICRSYPVFLIPQLMLDDSDIPVTVQDISWLGSLTAFMMSFGCLIGGAVMETFGRKFFLIILYVPSTIAWILTAFASNLPMLYGACVLNGIHTGMAQCVPTYIGEICTASRRGSVLSLVEPYFALGCSFCNICLYYTGWRTSAWCFTLVTIACLCAQFAAPESPNWLISKGRIDKATKTLHRIRISKTHVDKEMSELNEHYRNMSRQKSKLKDTLINLLSIWRQFLIVIGVNVLQHISGFSLLITYTVIFFENLDLPIDSNLAAITYCSVGFVSSFFIPFTIHFISRRRSLSVSGFGAGVSLAIVALYETVYQSSTEKPFFWVPVLCMCTYNIFVSLGIISICFILAGEMFPSHVAGLACGIYGCMGNIIGSGILKMFPYFLSTFGIINAVWVLCAASFANVLYATFILPETRGKTINEIQDQYFDKSKTLSIHM